MLVLKWFATRCQCLTNLSKNALYLYMASLAITMSSADWHKWRRSFSSSLSISSFFCSFWPRNSIKFPVQQGETIWALRYHCTWNCNLSANGKNYFTFRSGDKVSHSQLLLLEVLQFDNIFGQKMPLSCRKKTKKKKQLSTTSTTNMQQKVSFVKGLLTWEALITQHNLA